MATFEGDFVDPQPFPPSLVQADSTDESDNNAPKKSKSKSKKSKKEKKRKVLKPIEVHSESRDSSNYGAGGYQQSQPFSTTNSSNSYNASKTSIPNLYDPRERPSPSQTLLHRFRIVAEAGLDLIGFGRSAHSYSYVPTDEGAGSVSGNG
eukprot:CAMPEP_0182506712 /NCGR_PEP_ID=MMETSP1321-20130603/21777_1 /TAXON_ID=91990 /ORGANISM="Bolidomonas sp., Strain RCC1657" /LENGTH=149 /DNA_ID=CAMNT_0024712495 /DNA_START=95 /DNA_END=541 /DNA_ORIENTATION=-